MMVGEACLEGEEEGEGRPASMGRGWKSETVSGRWEAPWAWVEDPDDWSTFNPSNQPALGTTRHIRAARKTMSDPSNFSISPNIYAEGR